MFNGFNDPTENWCKLPFVLIERLPDFSSKAELSVVLYILRHTWGFQEFEDWDAKSISTDEFMNGRKRRDGTRLDNGCGMSRPSLYDGLERAIEHGFILRLVDNTDLGRVTHYYKLRMEGDALGTIYAIDPTQKQAVSAWHNIPESVRQQVYQRSQGRCAYCDRKSHRWHYDHILPKSKGGTDDESNLALACPPCNLSKNALTPDEWGHEVYFYDGDVKKVYRGWSRSFTPPGKEGLPPTEIDTSDRNLREENTSSVSPKGSTPATPQESKTVGKGKPTDTPHQDSLFAHNDPDDQPSPVVKRVPVKSAPTHPLRKQHRDAQGRKYNPYNNVITAFWLGKDPKTITPADSENTWGQIARMFKIDGAWQLLYDELGGFTPYELQVALYKWTQHPKNKEIAVVGRRPSWDKLYGHVAETIRAYIRQQRQQGN